MRRRYGMAPYWRGGLPVERGPYPATLEWRNIHEKTDNPELFWGWISDIEAVLATSGLGLVTQQSGGGRILFLAAGHKVAELKQMMGGGIEGIVFARPVGGPGPGARGAVAAEELRRSSQWLGYGSNGAARATVTGTFKREEETYTLAPTVPRPTTATVEAIAGELRIYDPSNSPHRDVVDEMYRSGTTRLAIGGVLGGIGLLGGLALAFLGKPLGTGAKVMAGIASTASAIGGTALGVHGYKKRSEAQGYINKYDRLDEMLEQRKAPGFLTSEDGSVLVDYDAAFYNSKSRPHPAIAAELQLISKNVPDEIIQNLRREGMIQNKAQGLTIESVPTLYGKPVWAEIGHITAEGRDVTVCSPASCADPISGREVWLHIFNFYGDRICRVRAHRYRGEWNWGWFPGFFDKASRQCIGCTEHTGSKAYVLWENGYDDFEGSGAPPAGFYMRASSNAWINDIVTGQALGSADMPLAGTLDAEPDRVRGPMGAVMQAFRSLRAASPEVTMMYFPTTWDLMQLCAATAKIRDARAWWMKVGDWIGTLFGVASFVCEIATPIIACINPAVGATIGVAMSAAIRAGQMITEAVEGRPGGVLDVIGNLGWTATDLQMYMREGWSTSTNFYDEVGAMVQGWLDANGLFAGDLGELATAGGRTFTDIMNPAQQYRLMTGQIYDLASSSIQRGINIPTATNVPFYVNKMISFSPLPKGMEGASFPMPDPRVAYAGAGD